MKLRLALAAATCLALPVVAHAQPVTGPYVNLQGGISSMYPVNFSDSYGASGKLLYKPNYAGIGGAGFGFGDGFRVQIDGDYFHNTVHKADFDAGGSDRLFGREDKYGAMLNILYDIPVGLPVFPYVGAGAGYQFINSKYSDGTELGSVHFSGAKGSFAYDLIAGLSYPLAIVPGLSITAEYRFMMLTSTYKTGFSTTGGSSIGDSDSATIKLGPESSNTFLVGLRYQLFPPPVMAPAPAPAPVAAPAPAPAKTYLVFFDWDKSVLTPRATQIIAEAASDSKTTGTTTINVSGYTDTSGTAVYNQGLSVRRAKAVAAQLVADGVPSSEIVAKGFGDTNLLVPTGPGVREPQNRRVEIVLD